jgi:hypothetical protein
MAEPEGDEPLTPTGLEPVTVGRVTTPTAWVGRATAPVRPPPTRPQVIVVEAPRRGPNFRLLTISVAIVAAFCAIGGTSLMVTSALLNHTSDPPAAAATTAPAPPKSPAPPGLNAPVRDGMFQFTVSQVSCGHSYVAVGLISRSAQGQFCLVTMTVTNVGRQGRAFSEAFQKALGDDGASYGPDTAAGLIVNGGGVTIWTNVNPGNHISGTIVFDIPRNRRLARLELHDQPFSTGAVITLH